MSHILPDSTKLRPSTKGTAYGDDLEGEIDSLVEKTSYTYDGDDLRVSKAVRKSGSGYKVEVTNYLYDRQNVILETDAEGNTRASYVKGINYISKTDADGKASYYLFNGHGDVVQTVDAAGTTQNQYEYDIWGNPVLTIETAAGNSIRYAGEFMDSEIGLYYLRARFYDPYLGRFTTEDSYWGEDENPLSLNLYAYCANDPVRYTNPSGYGLFCSFSHSEH
ncbi:tRNA nuclease WapA precursor [Ruminiclostridium hungatei]|uniref:tRNA nuclease WapA n=1 Tax=Ruminiclostridium hungatei TaxID=48256 RepID=A0A1V4SHJ6_RUMHU|nr:tRNA nuclease WapA precursor [Ruminiclostridium hungatei]